MLVQTTRFGEVTVTQEDLVEFPEGVLGFSHLRKFVFLDDPNDEIFAWLQSCEEASVAFPILEPELFSPTYIPKLTKSDIEAIGLAANQSPRAFTIVTIPQDVTKMTANLKAPIVVNTKSRLGRQCVLQDNDLPIREPIFVRLQERLAHGSQVKVKPQVLPESVIVKIDRPADLKI
jgi:flagellar assembly factor FliW